MSLLPSSPDISPDSEPRVVGLDSEEADDLMAALSSETARRILAELHEEPMPPGELADAVDTSLQNVQYHLEKLEDAGAIEVAGTAYSEKGREMNVYGPADSPLVIFAGEQERASGLRAAVSRLFGGFLALVAGALAIQELFGRSLLDTAREDAGGTATPTEAPESGGDAAGNGNGAAVDESPTPTPEQSDGGKFDTRAEDGADATAEPTQTAQAETSTPQPEATPTPQPEATSTPQPASTSTPQPQATSTPVEGSDDTAMTGEEATETATEVATETPAPEPEAAVSATETPVPTADAADPSTPFEALFGAGLPPGVAFFLGGATVLTVLVALSYYRSRP